MEREKMALASWSVFIFLIKVGPSCCPRSQVINIDMVEN
jgi:hypothetical protein